MEKILFISPFNIFPPFWGSPTRTYGLLKYFSRRYQTILLYPSYKQVPEPENREKYINGNMNVHSFGPPKRWAQFFNPLLIWNGLKILRTEKQKMIFAAHLWSGLNVMILYFLTRTPYILDEHNVEYLRMNRMGKNFGWLVKIFEKLCCRFAHKVLCVSKVDKEYLEQMGVPSTKIIVVPNSIDAEKFYPNLDAGNEIRKKLNISTNTPLILFFGKLDYGPNKEAVEIIRTEILPRVLEKIPHAKFLIVGANPPPEFKHESIIFTGLVSRVEDYINASDITIAPLLSGGGTRFKILESIACGKQVVSTAIGAEGLIDESSEDFLKIADDWDEFSRYITERKTHMADTKKFVEKYSWDYTVNQVVTGMGLH